MALVVVGNRMGSGWSRCSLVVCVALASACATGKDHGPRQLTSVSTEAACSTEGCGSRSTRLRLSVPSAALRDAVRDNGPGLPVTLSKKTAEAYLKVASVELQGDLVASVGPLGLQARPFPPGNVLTLSLALVPIPNASFVSANVKHPASVVITHVIDNQGRELLDPNSVFADSIFANLAFAKEPDPFWSPAGNLTASFTGYATTREDALLYAARQIGLTRSVTSEDIRAIEGEILLSLPLDVSAHVLSAAQAAVAVADCQLAMALSAGGTKMEISIRGGTDKYVGHVAFDASGQPLEATQYSAGGAIDENRITIRGEYEHAVDHVNIAIAPSALSLRLPFTMPKP